MENKISEIYFELLDLMATYNHRVIRNTKLSVPINQLILMYCLWNHGASIISDVSQMMSISKQQISQIIDKLVGRGFVEKQTMPRDKRYVQISLTDKGRIFFEEHRREMQQAFMVQVRDLSLEEQADFCKSVQCIKNVLLKIMETE